MPRHAVNNAAIARALGLSDRKSTVLAEIGRWIRRDDFPSKSRHGWIIADIQAWYANFIKNSKVQKQPPPQKGQQSLLIDRRAVDARKEAAVIEQWSANKLRDEKKLTPFERAVLVKHKIIQSDESEIQHGEESTWVQPAQNASTQTELAVMLARHFHGRFKGDLSQQLVCDWKAGKRLREGVPLPPPKEGVYFVGSKWVEWMETYILTDPRYKMGADAQGELDIHDRAYVAASEQKIFEKEIKRIQFELTQARYVPADAARNTRRGALKLAHSAWRRRLENDNTKKRSEWLSAHLSPNVLLLFREFDLSIEKQTVDFVERDFERLSKLDPETELARQLAEESSA